MQAEPTRFPTLGGRLLALAARSGRLAAVIFSVFFAACIWGAIWLKSVDDARQAEAAARSTGLALARSLEEQLLRTIGAIDQTLFYVRDLYLRAPGDFDLAALQRRGQYLTESAFQIGVVDRDGILLSSNLGAGGRINLADREHFRVHVDGKDDTLFISKPVFGRLSKKWSIQFTRRMTFSDGSFAGVVVASMDVAMLARFYSTVTIGRSGTILLAGDDGATRVSVPFLTEAEPVDLKPMAIWRMLAGAHHGSGIARFGEAAGEQLFVWRRVPATSLTLVVGQAVDDIQAMPTKSFNWMIASGVVLTLCLLGFLALQFSHHSHLARASSQADAGNRARSDFLAMMGHEIHTPLNGVIGIADILAGTELSADQRQMVESQKQSATQLLRLLDDVLDLARRDSGTGQPEMRLFSIDEVVEAVLGLSRLGAEQKALALECEVAPDLPSSFRGDPASIRQILLKLVDNAIKFTGKGRVAIKISGAPAGAGEYWLEMRVTDTGPGIDPSLRDRLFEPFSQGDQGISRRHGGTGLGLSICRRLARQMGGDIEETSEPGKGASFVVRLKMQALGGTGTQAADPAKTRAAKGSTPGLPSHRILLVEDDATNQFVIGQMLRQLGQQVQVAGDGQQALEAIRAQRFDLVLMDMMMPVMDGLAATRAIRALPGEAALVPIWALTANSLESDEAACRDAGMDRFVTKPITRERLESMLRRLATEDYSKPRSSPAVSADKRAPVHSAVPLQPAKTARRLSPKAAAEAIAGGGKLFSAAAYQALISDLGEEQAREILGIFMQEAEEYLDQLADSLAAENRQTMKRLAHSLKGSALTVGFGAISDLARQLESRVQHESLDVLSQHLDRITEEFQAIRDCLPQSLVTTNTP